MLEDMHNSAGAPHSDSHGLSDHGRGVSSEETENDGEDGEDGMDGAAAVAASTVLRSLLGGLSESGFVRQAHYDPRHRRLDVKLARGGAEGDYAREVYAPLRLLVDQHVRVEWDAGHEGAVTLRFDGLRTRPLPSAHEAYRRAGLDEFACPRTQFLDCHTRKARILQELWMANRTKFGADLQEVFSAIADIPFVMALGKRLGRGTGWGWAMLAVISMAPGRIASLQFAPSKGGLTGSRVLHRKRRIEVLADTRVDWSGEGAELAQRHDFAHLLEEVCRPLFGFTSLGGLIRASGERYLRLGTNFVVLLVAGSPKWRAKGVRGADASSVVELFGQQKALGSLHTGLFRRGRKRERGTVRWRPAPNIRQRGIRAKRQTPDPHMSEIALVSPAVSGHTRTTTSTQQS